MALYNRLTELGAVAFFPLDGDASDLTGNLTTGTPTDITWVSDSPFSDTSQCASFNGSTSKIVIPAAAVINDMFGAVASGNYVTIGCWVKVIGLGSPWVNNYRGAIAGKRDTVDASNGWEFSLVEGQIYARDDKWMPAMHIFGPTTNNLRQNASGSINEPTIDDGNWHFVSYSCRINADTPHEGVTVNGDQGNDNIIGQITGGDPTTDAGGDLYLGMRDSGSANPYKGYVAGLFIVKDRVANEMMAHIAQETLCNPNKYASTLHIDTAGAFSTQVLGHWMYPMNRWSGGDWLKLTNWAPKQDADTNIDARITVNPLELGAGSAITESLTTPADSGWSGAPFAINFPGGVEDDTNHLTTGSITIWENSYLNDGTIEVVFRVDSAVTAAEQIIFAAGRSYDYTLQEYEIKITTAGKLSFHLSRASGDHLEFESTSALSDNTWYHAIFRAKGDGSDYDLYLNGSEVAITTTDTPVTTTNSPLDPGYAGYIGNGFTHTSGNLYREPFDGDIALLVGYRTWVTDGNRVTLYDAVVNGSLDIPEPEGDSLFVLNLGNVF